MNVSQSDGIDSYLSLGETEFAEAILFIKPNLI